MLGLGALRSAVRYSGPAELLMEILARIKITTSEQVLTFQQEQEELEHQQRNQEEQEQRRSLIVGCWVYLDICIFTDS